MISGELATLLAVLARVSAWSYTAPLISGPSVPPRVRMGVALALAALVATARPAVDPDTLWSLIPAEVVLGLVAGFGARLIILGAEAAGQLIGMSLGIGFASFYDPGLGEDALPTRRIAGALDIEDREPSRRDVESPPVLAEGADALAPSRHDDLGPRELGAQLFQQSRSALEIVPSPTDRRAGLGEIRLHEARAPKACELALRIRGDEHPASPGRRDHAPSEPVREEPLVVVGEDHRVPRLEPLEDCPLDPGHFLRLEGRLVFAVEPQHLLTAGDDAQLVGRRPGRALDQAVRRKTGRHRTLAEPRSLAIHPDHADQGGLRAERDEIARHVRRAPELDEVLADPHDRNRRLGTDPRDLADPVLVEHQIAHDEDPQSLHPLDDGLERGAP